MIRPRRVARKQPWERQAPVLLAAVISGSPRARRRGEPLKSPFTAQRLRLIKEQQALIAAAAERDGLPPEPIIRQIADLERAVVCLEAIMDESTDRAS